MLTLVLLSISLFAASMLLVQQWKKGAYTAGIPLKYKIAGFAYIIIFALILMTGNLFVFFSLTGAIGLGFAVGAIAFRNVEYEGLKPTELRETLYITGAQTLFLSKNKVKIAENTKK